MTIKVIQSAATKGVNQALTLKSQIFTESGTWNKPVGVTSVDVILVGSGGGGGSHIGTSNGSSGGGGGAILKTKIAVTEDLLITIGAVALGGVATSNGQAGNDSTITHGTHTLTAEGGGLGAQANSSANGGDGGGANENKYNSDTSDVPGSGGVSVPALAQRGNNGTGLIVGGGGGSADDQPVSNSGGDCLGKGGNSSVNNFRAAGGGGGSFGKGGDAFTSAGSATAENGVLGGGGGGASGNPSKAGDGGIGYCEIHWWS